MPAFSNARGSQIAGVASASMHGFLSCASFPWQRNPELFSTGA